MNSYPKIVEFCGIPYSRKTTTINKLRKLLRKDGTSVKIVDEFRGDSNFYSNAKYTPDLNIVRASICIEKVVTSIHDGAEKIILIDRGPFDSKCWISWFDRRSPVREEIQSYSDFTVDLIKSYSQKYKVVWMDMDPILATAQHGRDGNIINLSTLVELRNVYREEIDHINTQVSSIHCESGIDNSDVIAERLFQKLKL